MLKTRNTRTKGVEVKFTTPAMKQINQALAKFVEGTPDKRKNYAIFPLSTSSGTLAATIIRNCVVGTVLFP